MAALAVVIAAGWGLVFTTALTKVMADLHGAIDSSTLALTGLFLWLHSPRKLKPGQRIVGPEEAAWMETTMATAMAAAMKGGEAPGASGLKLVSDGGA